MICGREITFLIDGNSITKSLQFNLLSALKIEECSVLKDSYIQLEYKVIK